MFPSWTALSETIKRYQREQYVQLWQQDSHKLEKTCSFNRELIYYEVNWNCIHGGRVHMSRSDWDRPNTNTYRQACPFVLKY